MVFLIVFCSFCHPLKTMGFAMLVHESVVAETWNSSILPLLKQKYPKSTGEELKDARAYVYGGTVIPDIGYYPFGDIFVTNLIHYVRTGDFIQALFDEARNLDEYAFAIGVLCHYTADVYGHSIATNRAVPLLFPKDMEKFGSIVTYEKDHISHMRMEFSFDVLKAVQNNYSFEDFHDFLNFKISEEVFERAFNKTYSLDLKKYFNPGAIAIQRYAIKHIYQEVTKDAWSLMKIDTAKSKSLLSRKKYEYRIKRKDYYKEYGKPEYRTILFYGVIKLLPKVGPLLVLKYKEPTTEVEKLLKQGEDSVAYNFAATLKRIHNGNTVLKNKDYDTGNLTEPGEYSIADKCYSKLLLSLENDKFQGLTPELKYTLIHYYQTPDSLKFPERNTRKWREVSEALTELKVADTGKSLGKL